jgi:hypothetical protein
LGCLPRKLELRLILAQASCLPVGRLSAIVDDVLANRNDSGESVEFEELLGEIFP